MSRTRLRSQHIRRHRRKKRSEFRRRSSSGRAVNPGAVAMPMLAPLFDVRAVVAAVNTLFRKVGRGPS